MASTAVVIPASEHNVYSPEGDLAPFGDVSLLEWKLSQLKALGDRVRVYVSTSSPRIAAIAGAQGGGIIHRPADISLQAMIKHALESVSEDVVLWTFVTVPFVSAGDYNSYLEAYDAGRDGHDSLLTVHTLHEYALYRGEPVNFSPREHRSRREIDPVQVITNGCFIIGRELGLRLNSYHGEKPLRHEVSRLTAMEIKDFEDLTIANDLLTRYMRLKEMA